MNQSLTRILAAAVRGFFHMRHPTRRGFVLALAALPTLLMLYVLMLIPFTRGIDDLR